MSGDSFRSQNVSDDVFVILVVNLPINELSRDLPPGFLSLRKEEPHPELFPQTPVSSYSWPRRILIIKTNTCFFLVLQKCLNQVKLKP